MNVIVESYWKNNQFASICANLILEVDGHRLRVSIDTGRSLQGASKVERWNGASWAEVYTVWGVNELKCLSNWRKAGLGNIDLASDIFAEDVAEMVRVAKAVVIG